MDTVLTTQLDDLGPGRHTVAKGLQLFVKSDRQRSWVFRMQVGGKRRDFGLGSYPAVSLDQAVTKAEEKRAALTKTTEYFHLQTISIFNGALAQAIAEIDRLDPRLRTTDRFLGTLNVHIPKPASTETQSEGYTELTALREDLGNRIEHCRTLLDEV